MIIMTKKQFSASIEESVLAEFNRITDLNHQNRSAITEDLIKDWNAKNRKPVT